MVVYVKDSLGRLKTLFDLAQEYNLPVILIQQRWSHGKKTIEELTLPKNYYKHNMNKNPLHK